MLFEIYKQYIVTNLLIYDLVTSSTDSTSVNCSSRNFPPWASLMWFSSGPVDSLVNGHKWHPRATLRWRRGVGDGGGPVL